MDKQLQEAIRRDNPSELFKCYSRTGEQYKTREAFFRSGRESLAVTVMSYLFRKAVPKHCDTYDELVYEVYRHLRNKTTVNQNFLRIDVFLKIPLLEEKLKISLTTQDVENLLFAIEKKYSDYNHTLHQELRYIFYLNDNIIILEQMCADLKRFSFEKEKYYSKYQTHPFVNLMRDVQKSYMYNVSGTPVMRQLLGPFKIRGMRIWKEKIQNA